jgi:hypothetical protein
LFSTAQDEVEVREEAILELDQQLTKANQQVNQLLKQIDELK